jgi:non-ribosomal peptide synthetase component E (peptide arylation enzyme)
MSRSILRVIADHAANNPGALALLAPGRQPLTYARLYAEIEKNAYALTAIGIARRIA